MLFRSAAPLWLRSPFFDQPALWWVGLSQAVPRSNDYVPLLPWFGAFLLGMAACRVYLSRRPPVPLVAKPAAESRWTSLLAAGGRHSLVIYLLHQPLLIALVYLFTVVMPPEKPDPVASYSQSCVAACGANMSAAFCRSFCDCALDQLQERKLLDGLYSGTINAGSDPRIAEISRRCTAEAQSSPDSSE